MLKYLLLIPFLASCYQRTCAEQGQPTYPAIGGCIAGAAQGEAGGPCDVGNGCNSDDLECVSGSCYPCGALTNPAEPCCGGYGASQTAAMPGNCPLGGMCAIDSTGDGWYSCQGQLSGSCQQGSVAEWHVWVIDANCGAKRVDLCADDLADAQVQFAAGFAGATHGDFAHDENSTAPQAHFVCAGGPSCQLTSDPSMATELFAFTDAQVQACEGNLSMSGGPDEGCTWTASPMNNDSCQ